jgi:hypothetical protein
VLASALDQAVSSYLTRLLAAVGIISNRCVAETRVCVSVLHKGQVSAAGLGSSASPATFHLPLHSTPHDPTRITAGYARLVAASPAAADVSALLQLVLLAKTISRRLGTLETHLRSAITTAIPRLQQMAAAGLPPPTLTTAVQHGHAHQHHAQQPATTAGGGSAAAGVTAAAAAAAAELLPLRLAAFSAKLAPLAKLRAAAGSSRFMSLPAAHAAGAALVEAITAAVYEALTAPVAAALRPLPGLREWTATVPGQASGVVTGAGV